MADTKAKIPMRTTVLEKHMNHIGWKTALALLTLGASLTAAGETPGISFSHGDWEIACDNTLTCRMAGYSSEEDAGNGRGYSSILITRAAGPNALLEGKVSLADHGKYERYKPPRVLTFRIDGKSKGELNLREEHDMYPLAPTQTQALLAAARRDRVIRFTGGSKSFMLSGAGVSAVMLKMDEVQGRIGTPGALIRKGNKSEESVPPPPPKPVIRAAKVSDAPYRALSASEATALKPLLIEDGRECLWGNEPTLRPLDEQHVLISVSCPDSAGHAYWVMDGVLKGLQNL
jgi:hypothetical protein